MNICPLSYDSASASSNIKLIMYHVGLINLVCLKSQLKAVVDLEH